MIRRTTREPPGVPEPYASPETKIRALIALLIRKGVLTEEEIRDEIRAVSAQRAASGEERGLSDLEMAP